MILLLFSLIILVAQGLLGMTDWWVLGSNCVVAGLVCGGLTMVLNAQRLVAFNHLSVGLKAWALLTNIMNLSAIYVASSLSVWQVDVLVVGFAGIFMMGSYCWQSKRMPVRSLLLGAIIGLLTLFYIPTLLWIVFPLLILYYCLSWSKDNLACLLTGLVSLVWINYCLLSLFHGDANGYILSFATSWTDMTYGLPTLLGDGYTKWVFLGATVFLLFNYILLGLFSSNLNSLHMRSNVSLQVVVGLLMLSLLPSCWQLFIVLIGVSICLDMLLALGNEPSRRMVRWADIAIGLFLFMGVGEYLIRLLIDYVSTLSFSLPFDIPFLS